MLQAEMDVQTTEKRIRELERDLAKLRNQRDPAVMKRRRREHTPEPAEARDIHSARIYLAPGFIATTQPGSLYSTILLVMARHGDLGVHVKFFGAFRAARTPDAARELLAEIGVTRKYLDEAVRRDEQFREHCENQTRRLKNLAAKGNDRARAVLANPAICDARGNWRGDIDEAVQILYGRRAPDIPGRHKNTDIIRRLKLLFDCGLRGSDQVCFLYHEKYYYLFQKARALALE